MYRVGDPNPVRRSTKSDLLGCGPLAIPRRHPAMLTRDDRTPTFLMADRAPAAVVGCEFLDAVDRHDRRDREAPRRERLVPLSAQGMRKGARPSTGYPDIARSAEWRV